MAETVVSYTTTNNILRYDWNSKECRFLTLFWVFSFQMTPYTLQSK